MITIFIDNQPRKVEQHQNLLQACLTLGFDLPYFCWHPALHAVGACRQCAVKQFKDEHDVKGRIIMSCMTPVAEGMRISVNDAEARAFRKGVIEYLMLNHPHDCPVCDEGGECHLQDMTVMTGHAYRRTRFPKRTHRNQELGPFINHEMNRCIQCYRCVRYYRDTAGGRDLNVFGCHDHVYFGRHEDGMLESEFSGNLVEICPTGVFTDKTLKRHYTRKWDLQTAPSVCAHCGLGCNTIAGERYGSLRRILNRYHRDVNGYYLCDRGRFGYGFVNTEERIRQPLAGRPRSLSGRDRGEGVPQPVAKESVMKTLADILSASKGIIAIGSPRASLESNFALRTLAGPDNFYIGMADREHRLVDLIIDILRKGPARAASLQEAGNADAVLVLGEDVTNTAPLLALSMRRAVRQREFQMAAKAKVPLWNDAGVRNTGQGMKSPLFIAAPYDTKLDDAAASTYRAAPDDIARLGYAVARELDPLAPEVPDLSAELSALARDAAAALRSAERPLVVAGTSLFSEAVVRSAGAVAAALARTGRTASILYTLPECNSMGLGLMAGRNLGEAFTVMSDGLADTVIVLENDLYRRADAGSVDAFLNKANAVIVLDHLMNPTVSQADIALPSGTFAESTGTVVNNEGRAQRFYQVFAPDAAIMPGWRWLDAVMRAGNRLNSDGRPFDDVVADMAATLAIFEPVRNVAPPATYRIAGQEIPRQSHRCSGRTAMNANIDVSEQKPPDDPDSPLAYSMEGSGAQPPSPLISRYWSPGWNSVQALSKFRQEAGGPRVDGEAGRLLIASDTSGALTSASPVPDGFTARPGRWLLVPRHHLFGSEELSSRTPDAAELVPRPYLALGRKDAATLGLEAGDLAEVSFGDIRLGVPVVIDTELPSGVAAYPFGPLFPFAVNGPVFCAVTKRAPS